MGRTRPRWDRLHPLAPHALAGHAKRRSTEERSELEPAPRNCHLAECIDSAMRPPIRLIALTAFVAFSVAVSPASARPQGIAHNTLTPDEQAAGWRLLFDGRSTSGWRGYREQSVPNGWKVADGTLMKTDAT